MAVASRKSIMTLYSGVDDPNSHQVRIVLAEKGVVFDLIQVKNNEMIEGLYEVNPYGSFPTLVDRDLVLYDAKIINEYLDERFPHPPLLPVYPVGRAECRKMIYRIERDWYHKMYLINNGTEKQIEKARKDLQNTLAAIASVFNKFQYFMSDEFTLVDCMMAPLLWRLARLGITIPSSAKGLKNYAERLFARESFKQSLTDIEREVRAA